MYSKQHDLLNFCSIGALHRVPMKLKVLSTVSTQLNRNVQFAYCDIDDHKISIKNLVFFLCFFGITYMSF